MQSVKDKADKAMNNRDSLSSRVIDRKKTLHESDQALADVLRRQRREESNDGDDIMDKMRAETRQDMRDVNPLESQQKSRTIDAKPVQPSMMKNKLMGNSNNNKMGGGQQRKVRGMMGLAIQQQKNMAVDAV